MDIQPLEDVIRTIAVSLLGAACLTAGLLLLRSSKAQGDQVRPVPPGESVPGTIVLERLRELGI